MADNVVAGMTETIASSILLVCANETAGKAYESVLAAAGHTVRRGKGAELDDRAADFAGIVVADASSGDPEASVGLIRTLRQQFPGCGLVALTRGDTRRRGPLVGAAVRGGADIELRTPVALADLLEAIVMLKNVR